MRSVSWTGVAAAKTALASGLLATLAACATTAAPDLMVATVGVPPPVAASGPGYHEVRVGHVQGGGETNPLWGAANVSNEDFRSALEASLGVVGYLADSPDKARLQVDASIVDLQRPVAGADLRVTSKVRYTVAPVGGGAPVFDETISAAGTARFNDAFMAADRLRLANEASVRANIAAFLQRLHDVLNGKS